MARRVGGIGSELQNSLGSRSQPQEMCPDPPGSGQNTWIPARIRACKQSENTVKTPCKNTVDDGVGFVYDYDYDHDMSSIGTACTVTGAVIEAVLIGAVLRSAVIGAP